MPDQALRLILFQYSFGFSSRDVFVDHGVAVGGEVRFFELFAGFQIGVLDFDFFL